MKKIAICQILPALETGGVERGTIEIARALCQKGWTNYVISNGGPMVKELEKLGVEHIQLPVHSKNPIKMFLSARKLKKIIKEKGITLVHARSRAPAWVAWLALRGQKKVKFLTSFHGTYGLKPRIFKTFYNAVMLKSERVICVSDFIKNHILKNYAVNPEKLTVVHRGADVETFNPIKVSPKQKISLSRYWHLPFGKKVILLPGRLTHWKGHLDLIEAFSLMRHRDFVGVFVGSDQGRVEYSNQIRQKIAEKKLKGRVLIKKRCDQMPVAYFCSDIVVCPSLEPEAFGRTVPEAQAMGCLTVAYAHGGAMETIKDGQNGFLINVGDIKALAQKLDELLDLTEVQKQKIAQQAIKGVRDNFSISKMCEKTLKIYEEMHS